MSDSDSWLTDSQSCLTDSQLVIIINVFLLIQFHNILYSIILSFTFLTDLRVTTLIDSLIDWLLVSELDSVSQPHRSHQISDIHWVSVTVSCVLIWFIDWRWKMSTDWGWGLQMRHIIFLFWLNEGIWFCLVNDNKLTKMNPLSLWWFNEACVPISPQTECTLSLLSINANPGSKVTQHLYYKDDFPFDWMIRLLLNKWNKHFDFSLQIQQVL